ncbi:MAG: aspartate-semialdehyde dehydrogenase [Coriobacteriales bacterium]|nr:aspartate-semialdehyde dehydrogenase [Coriobacteriales bacterium]
MGWSKQMPKNPVVAVCGATGAVGREMLNVLEQRNFPACKVVAMASYRSAGKKLPFAGGELEVIEMTPESFEGIDIALFSAGASVSKEMRQHVVGAGAVMIDNSSAFRMEDDVPLVVPEVNPQDIGWHSGVISNPNCSTIEMVVALKPLHDLGKIERVVVSTYQAASGAGAKAMDELYEQSREFLAGEELTINHFAHQIAFNTIPHIDKFLDDDYTKEEWKMVVETKKIMGDSSINVAPTCVRVPVLRCHAESLNIEFANEVSPEDARRVLENAPGVAVMDDPANNVYPMQGLLANTDDVYVGRIRKDPTVEHGIALWLVMDQIRKGAALNAVQIAEMLIG